MTAIRLAAAAAVLAAAAPCPAQEPPRREGLPEWADKLAKDVQQHATKIQQPGVIVGFFTPSDPNSPEGNAGGALQDALAHALQGFLLPTADLIVEGKYDLVDDPRPENAGLKVVRINAKLLRKSTQREERDFSQSVAYIRSNSDIARIDPPGAAVLKANAEYANPREGRNRGIVDGMSVAGRPPKVRAFVDGTQVRAAKDSPYAIEIRKKPVNDPGAARPVPVELKDGLAFAPIGKGEVYEVRVVNHAPHEIAVSLAIDGIDQFTFSEDREPETDDDGKPVTGFDGRPRMRPRFSHWIVDPAKDGRPGEVLIVGWHKTADPNRKDNVMSFLVTEYGKGAASQFPTRAQGKVGSIAVAISRSFPAGTARDGGETGLGPPREVKQEVVKRSIDPPHTFVTIRYTR